MEDVLLDRQRGDDQTTKDLGCVGYSLYPGTKMDVPRMVEIVRRVGIERIVVNSADWGISDPLMVPRLAHADLR